MLVVTRDEKLVSKVEALLRLDGLQPVHCAGRDMIDKLVGTESPVIALVDTEQGETEALQICVRLRELCGADKMAILVLVDGLGDATLSGLLDAGADGLVGRKLRPLSFNARVSSHLARIGAGKKLASRVRDSEVLINITSRLVGTPDILGNLFDVAKLISTELMVTRCSVVLVRPQRDFGLVVASSDDPDLRSLAIELDRYPEITRAVDTGAPVIIDDVRDSLLLERVLPDLLDAGVASVALFPITRQGETLGVIFLRFREKRDTFEQREVVFCQTVANAASIALRNAEILELLKAKTREVEKVQIEALHQLQSLKKYEDFFVGALDGMVVLEQTGTIVFINPKASEVLGTNESSPIGQEFASFIRENQRGAFDRLLHEFGRGEARRSVDFNFEGDREEEQIISISAGSLFDEEGMMLLTIRDVTEERMMQRRLGDAQRRLVQGEKQAAMAQLAGAAAHELNQPLTSIMTSVAMLRRLKDDTEKQQRIILTMEKEAERMAAIIRRLTKITNYTTKQYVGDAKIIDLDTACPEDFQGDEDQ